MSSDKITQYSDSEYPEDESKGSDPNRRRGAHEKAVDSPAEGSGVGNLPFKSSSSSTTPQNSSLHSTPVDPAGASAGDSHLNGSSAGSTFLNNDSMGMNSNSSFVNNSGSAGDNHLGAADSSSTGLNSSSGLHNISGAYDSGLANGARSVGKHGINISGASVGKENIGGGSSSYKEEPLSMANLLDNFSALSMDKNPFKLDDAHENENIGTVNNGSSNNGILNAGNGSAQNSIGGNLGSPNVGQNLGSSSVTPGIGTNAAIGGVPSPTSNIANNVPSNLSNSTVAGSSTPISSPANTSNRAALFSDYFSPHSDTSTSNSDINSNSSVTGGKAQANGEVPQTPVENRTTRVFQPIKDSQSSDNYSPVDKSTFGDGTVVSNSEYDTKDFAKKGASSSSKGRKSQPGAQAPSYVPDRTQVLSSRDLRDYKTAQDGETTGEIPMSDMASMNRNTSSGDTNQSRKARRKALAEDKPKVSVALSIFEILGEILLTAAVFLAFYILWQLWWTGVVSQHVQQAQVAQAQWVQPKEQNGSYQIAQPQPGPPPVLPAPTQIGELIGQVYIPRFGAEWHRNLVQGTSLEQLARHGLCHYVESQMPGAIGNFAIAGHRSGYGEPLGNVNELQKGDAFIIRTKDYWYVYEDTGYEIVLPSQIGVIYPVPNQPDATPTQRLITLTTCTPRYTNATHRWVVYGKMKYWAKVADGIPEQLATPGGNGKILFTQASSTWTSKIPPLTTILIWLLVAYAIFFISGAAAWRWPGFKRKYRKGKDNVTASMYGFLYRIQPGIAIIRWIELILLFCIVVVCLFQWVYPAMAENIPYLRVTSNYVGVGE